MQKHFLGKHKHVPQTTDQCLDKGLQIMKDFFKQHQPRAIPSTASAATVHANSISAYNSKRPHMHQIQQMQQVQQHPAAPQSLPAMPAQHFGL